MRTLLKCINYSISEVHTHAKSFFYLFIIKNIFSSIRVFLFAWISKLLLNEIAACITDGQITLELFVTIIISISCEILFTISFRIVEYYSEKSTLRYNNYLTLKNAQKYFSLKYEFYDDPNQKNQLQQFLVDNRAIIDLFCQIVTFTITVITFVISLFISIHLSIFITCITLLASVPSFFVKKKIKKDTYEAQKNLNTLDRKIEYYKNIFISQNTYKELHLFHAEFFFKDILNRHLQERQKARETNNKRILNKEMFLIVAFSIINFISNIGLIFIIVISKLTIGDYGYYNTIIANLKRNTEGLVSVINEIIISVKKVDTVMFFYNNGDNEYNRKGIDPEINVNSIKIVFDHVWFKYPNNSEYVLRDINFTIKGNEKVAFAGINGAGKSTIIKLLLRFYTPTEGNIYINGININDIMIDKYWELFSTMFQDSNLYELTLKENVCISNTREAQGLSDDEIVHEGIEMGLNLNREILDMHVGRNFNVNGLVFSPGQVQKLSVLRTICGKSNILIFDEPSAAMDAISENKIIERVFDLTDKKMMVFISHRLSNLKKMDKIVFLENGVISELGTHDDLMNNKASYYNMYEIQAQKYN